jgi:hypothetical protein
VYLSACYLILRRIFADFPIAAPLGTFFIAISYTFGTFFRNASPYMIPMSICSLIFLRIIWQSRKEQRFHVTSWDWILLFLAVLCHQIALLVMPAVIFAQMMAVNRYRSRIIIRNIFAFFTALWGIYLVVYYFAVPNPAGVSFFTWVSGYARINFWVFTEVHGFIPVIQKSAIESLMSHKALFIAPVDRTLLRLHDFNMAFGNDYLDSAIGWILFLVIVTFIASGICHLTLNKTHKSLSIFLLIWILPNIVLFQLFTPYQSFYRMFYLFPLVIFFLEGIRKIKWKGLVLICGIFLLLCFVYNNFARGFIPESIPLNNPHLAFAQQVKMNTTDRDTFLFGKGDYFAGFYVRYFGNRDIFWITQFPIEKYPEATF